MMTTKFLSSFLWSALLCLLGAALCEAQSESTGVDCSKATDGLEKVVCSNADLRKLDQQLSGLGSTAEKNRESAGKRGERQREWIAARNACVKNTDVKGCVQSSYEQRIAEIQIQSGVMAVPRPVAYDCGNATKTMRFTASFYNDTKPPSALLTYGKDQVVAMVQRSGSGARYGSEGVEYWEHQGTATISWHGKQFTCKVAGRR